MMMRKGKKGNNWYITLDTPKPNLVMNIVVNPKPSIQLCGTSSPARLMGRRHAVVSQFSQGPLSPLEGFHISPLDLLW